MSLAFQPIRITDQELFQQYQPQGCRICDQSFTSLFCWQDFYHTQWAVVEDRLVVSCQIYGEGRRGYMILPDLRTERLPALLQLLQEDSGTVPLTLINLSEEDLPWLQEHQPGQWGFDHNRDYDDYLYETVQFQTYKGKKLAAKRNHVNKFVKSYDYSYEPLSEQWFEACLQLEQLWQDAKGTSSEQQVAEQAVIRKAFQHFDALHLLGGVLLSAGVPIAFTYGSPLNRETFDIHIEKADTSFEGGYPMMAQLFAQHLPANYRYINREEDLGLPGLRKSKESYHPIRMEEKITAVAIDRTMHEIVEVWTRCFGDEPAFVHSFLARYYAQDRAFLHREEGRVVGTCFLILCETELGHVGYLYAIATLPEYRRQGIAAELVRQALDHCRDLQLTAALLIPADDTLAAYYAQFGFSQDRVALQFTHDMDLGTGDPDKDKALFIKLKEDIDMPKSLNCTATL